MNDTILGVRTIINGEKLSKVGDTLNIRELTHGSYIDNSALSEALLDLCKGKLVDTNFEAMSSDQKYSITMFCYKMARILVGNPNHSDSWHDIAGYATLVDNRLKLEGQ